MSMMAYIFKRYKWTVSKKSAVPTWVYVHFRCPHLPHLKRSVSVPWLTDIWWSLMASSVSFFLNFCISSDAISCLIKHELVWTFNESTIDAIKSGKFITSQLSPISIHFLPLMSSLQFLQKRSDQSKHFLSVWDFCDPSNLPLCCGHAPCILTLCSWIL